MNDDPLVEHYQDVIRMIERLCMARVPKWLRKSGLSDYEVQAVAIELATAHDIALEQEADEELDRAS